MECKESRQSLSAGKLREVWCFMLVDVERTEFIRASIGAICRPTGVLDKHGWPGARLGVVLPSCINVEGVLNVIGGAEECKQQVTLTGFGFR